MLTHLARSEGVNIAISSSDGCEYVASRGRLTTSCFSPYGDNGERVTQGSLPLSSLTRLAHSASKALRTCLITTAASVSLLS